MAIKIKRRRVPLDEKQKRQRQFAIVVIFLAAALFFLGFSVGKNSATDDKSTASKANNVIPTTKPRTEISNVGPTNFDLIVPTGFKDSEAGAKKAAATYVQSWAQLVFSSDANVINAINYVTNPDAKELRAALANTIVTARTSLSKAIAGQAYHQSVPMKIKVESFDSKNATISVWSAEFWAAAGDLAPQGNFDLHELKLIYMNGDWKIDSWITTPGPTPNWVFTQEPMSSLDFMSALAGYEEYKR